ncbi:MAG TPA: XdhC/CoxI family protein [Candidatus Cloacimonadota bacterium]|nr:XdhC/CoxI family protein [Candidatus Cloacimonadota bacterium]
MSRSEYYCRLQAALDQGQDLWQATIVSTDGSSPARAGMKACIGPKLYFGNLGGGALEHGIIAFVRTQRPETPLELSFDLGGEQSGMKQTGMICGGAAAVFIEPLHNPDKLYIIGAGHCGTALAELAAKAEFGVTLIDNRPESLAAPALSGYRRLLSDYTDIGSVITDIKAWIVIMTHGHAHDKEVLRQCLDLPCRYLGMIGSKHKVAESFEKLMEAGVSEQQLASVHAPIGLPIGSRSPVEIAISIMAELIRVRSSLR